MNYTVEDISPTRKKVSVTVPAEEVNAALAAQTKLITEQNSKISYAGFRQGKVPEHFIEQKLHKEINNRARQDLYTVHINTVLNETGLLPISDVSLSKETEAPLVKNQGLTYTMEMEVLPELTLPNYEGLNVTVRKIKDNYDEETIYKSRLEAERREKATLADVKEKRPAKDGEIAVLDYAFFDNSVTVADVRDFYLAVGDKYALPEFIELVKKIPLGKKKEGYLTFPNDFIEKELQGKTVKFWIHVKAIKQIVLPEVNMKFIKQFNVSSPEELRVLFLKDRAKMLENDAKEAAKADLMAQIIKQLDFVPPKLLVDQQYRAIVEVVRNSYERQGKNFDDVKAELEPRLRSDAEFSARVQMVALFIARKENLDANEAEAMDWLFRHSVRCGENFHVMRERYIREGLMSSVYDGVKRDKAIDLVFARANVTYAEAEDKVADNPAKDAVVSAEKAPETAEGQENKTEEA